MKKASKVMYIIGKVFNIIEIVCLAFAIAGGIVMLAMAPQIADQGVSQAIEAIDTIEKVTALGVTTIIASIISLILDIIVLIFVNRALKALDENNTADKPHIIMLVLGIFTDVFYFLGGLFGLLINKQNSNNSTTVNE